MQIAATPTVAPGEVLLRPGQAPLGPSLSPAAINDPAARFARVYTQDIFSLMGVQGMSYTTGKMDQVKIRFQNYDFAKLADGVLKDTVLGAKLTYADAQGNLFDMTQPASDWVAYPTNYARIVASMPGVNAYMWVGTGGFLLEPDSVETRVRLRPLIERYLDGKYSAYFRGECFGKSCPVDPPPPTGEV